MVPMKIRSDSTWLIFLMFLSLILLFHCNFIFPAKTISPDAQIILSSIESYKSLFDYFSSLFSFGTIDIQPVRDASLFFDLWIFRHTGLNLFIFTNCLILAGICSLIYQSIEKETLTNLDLYVFIVIGCFAVHPAISQSVNWTMARKHLLAVFFIILATKSFLRSGRWYLFFYVISLLSNPVALLWPVWAVSRRGLKNLFKKESLPLMISLFIMLGAAVVNYIYYFQSTSFQAIYGVKPSTFAFTDIFLHLSKHLFQIFIPYQLTFKYQLTPQDLWGFLPGVITVLILLKFRLMKNWKWLTLGLIPLLLFLKTPGTFYDTYLILPLLGLIATFCEINSRKKFQIPVALGILLIFGTFTLSNNRIWERPHDFFARNFSLSMSCSTAQQYALHSYLEKTKLRQDAYDFLENNDCLNPELAGEPITRLLVVHIESMKYLIEDDIELSYRKEKLLEMGTKNYYPLLMYATLMAKENDSIEFERAVRILNEKFQGTDFRLDPDGVYSRVLPEFCRNNNIQACDDLLKRIRPEIDQPYI